MTNTELAQGISDSNAVNCANINERTIREMPVGEAILVCPIGDGGNGINATVETLIYDRLIAISEADADEVNGLVTTGYMIVSQNGYPI